MGSRLERALGLAGARVCLLWRRYEFSSHHRTPRASDSRPQSRKRAIGSVAQPSDPLGSDNRGLGSESSISRPPSRSRLLSSLEPREQPPSNCEPHTTTVASQPSFCSPLIGAHDNLRRRWPRFGRSDEANSPRARLRCLLAATRVRPLERRASGDIQLAGTFAVGGPAIP